jgi:hypothetical protein
MMAEFTAYNFDRGVAVFRKGIPENRSAKPSCQNCPDRAKIHKGPCVTGALGFTQDRLQPLEEILPVGILPKNLTALNPTANDMLLRTRCVDERSSWHVA